MRQCARVCAFVQEGQAVQQTLQSKGTWGAASVTAEQDMETSKSASVLGKESDILKHYEGCGHVTLIHYVEI